MSDQRIDRNIDVKSLDKNKMYVKATAEYLAFLMEIRKEEWVWISVLNYTELKWGGHIKKYPFIEDYNYGKIISTHKSFEESISTSLKKYCMVFQIDNLHRFTKWYLEYGFDKARYIRENIKGTIQDEDVI